MKRSDFYVFFVNAKIIVAIVIAAKEFNTGGW